MDPLFDTFETGRRRDFHTTLFQGEIDVMDRLARDNQCSRGAIIGALLRKYHNAELNIPADVDQKRKRTKE